MNTYFIRFLHHVLSLSGTKPQSTPSLSHSDLIGVSRSNKFAALFNLDHRVKPDDDNMENIGRSMVEMLGVLAIIGVLSVGAIAGYGKAMFKYKLNKQTEQLNQLINAVTQYFPQLHSKISIDLVPIFKKLNIIPKEMIKDNNSVLIYDIFNNAIAISTGTRNDVGNDTKYALLNYYLDFNNSNSIDVCRNTIIIMKENHENLWLAETWSTTSGSQNIQYAGDKFCTGAHQEHKDCLKYLDLEMADKICRNKAGDDGAKFSIWWRN